MYGLVLEGGGAKGSYHAGVYKAILEEGIEIKAVAGTSIGALNGAMIVQGDYEANLDLWNDISYTDIIQANEEEIERLLNTKLDLEDLKLLSKKIISLVTDRGFDISPFKEMINRYLDEEKLRSSPMDFGIVTINLTDRVPVEVFLEDIPEGKVGDYLLASSYVPIFKLEKLDGKIYLDGGFYDNLPFRMLQRKGYKDLILVRTHSKGIIRRPAKGRGSMIVISPSRDIGRSFICDKEQAKTNIKMGYHDALKVFRGLQGKMYYIEAEDEDYYLDYLLNLNEAKIKAILDQLNISSQPSKRILLEHIVPKLGSIMGLREDFTYGEFVIELLEKKAAQLSIEEYKIYAFEDLLKLVRNAEPIELKVVEDSTLEKIIKKVDLVKYFNKEEAILKIVNIILLA